MKLRISIALLSLAVAQFSWGETTGVSTPTSAKKTLDPGTFTVIGATAEQEAFLRSQIRIMHPLVLPLRVLFVPHWKYVDAARTFQLHVPTGYTSAMFTHLPSRTTFIDSDRYQNEDWLGYWMAHELGHLATNSTSESDANKSAREYRKRLSSARESDKH